MNEWTPGDSDGGATEPHQGAADDLAESWETGQGLTAKKRENESPARANCIKPEPSMTQARNVARVKVTNCLNPTAIGV
jgi:hypothetical protein